MKKEFVSESHLKNKQLFELGFHTIWTAATFWIMLQFANINARDFPGKTEKWNKEFYQVSMHSYLKKLK